MNSPSPFVNARVRRAFQVYSLALLLTGVMMTAAVALLFEAIMTIVRGVSDQTEFYLVIYFGGFIFLTVLAIVCGFFSWRGYHNMQVAAEEGPDEEHEDGIYLDDDDDDYEEDWSAI